MPGCKAGDKAIVIGPPNPDIWCPELKKNIGKVVNVLRKSPEDSSAQLERMITGYKGPIWIIETANPKDVLVAHHYKGDEYIEHSYLQVLTGVFDLFLHPIRPSRFGELTDTSKDKDIPVQPL